MTVTNASFRGAFPEFSNPTTYPSTQIDFWLALAAKLLDVARWGDLYDFGIQLFVAHNLSLEYEAQRSAKSGGNPGVVVGPVTSGSVDKVSYSRDVSSVMDPKNGHWNLSTYGLRYVNLVRMIGAGPIYVGAPSDTDLTGSLAWPGPILTPPY